MLGSHRGSRLLVCRLHTAGKTFSKTAEWNYPVSMHSTHCGKIWHSVLPLCPRDEFFWKLCSGIGGSLAALGEHSRMRDSSSLEGCPNQTESTLFFHFAADATLAHLTPRKKHGNQVME